ncbi:c-type cytochrome [Leptobacterium flavescens]|uniref:C-type cytochrome n=1 Tax=Leptobacterium flavescens TaxID=472055 RepID=A0A6P0USA8_9FLAO|nr:cytochrome c [Leptobacterium flavescens]NER14699.1 c-type cytochrome [Leptobacterium flavescens]
MKYAINFAFLLVFGLLVMSCGKEKKEEKSFQYERTKSTEKKEVTTPADNSAPASSKVDLSNKGIGPVTSISIDSEIDQAMATKGEEVFKSLCAACHKPAKKFIGPAPKGILERRTPEWVMNMILNPEEMIQKDPLAKELLIEFNGAPMANQNLTEEQARSVLEYFRTIK